MASQRSPVLVSYLAGQEQDRYRQTKSYRLQVDHIQARLNGRFSHPAVEGQDVSRRTLERQCEVWRIER
jgi:hypothetical protein